MAKLFAIYQQPADASAFDAYYFGKHVPLAKTGRLHSARSCRWRPAAQGQIAESAGKLRIVVHHSSLEYAGG